MKHLTFMIIIASFVAGLPAANATVIVVTTTADQVQIDGLCSIREAITAANTDVAYDSCAAGAGDSDIIALPTGTYQILIAGRYEDNNSSGDFDVLEGLTIKTANSQAQVILDGGDFDRVLHVHSGISLYLANVTVSGGDPQNTGGGILNEGSLSVNGVIVTGNQGTNGGGIANTYSGTVSVQNCRIEANEASGHGGGIFDEQSSDSIEISDSTIADNSAVYSGGGIWARTLAITGSTVSGNTAGTDGGGLSWPSDSGHMNSIVNSTISGNQAYSYGGGINFDGAGILNLSNVTITNNTADVDGNDDGGGGGVMIRNSGQVRTRNSIIAANHDLSTGTFAEYSPDCFGDFTSYGFNLFGAPGAGMCNLNGGSGDQIGMIGAAIDPQLGTLQSAGGTTMVHVPLADSTVVDAGDPAGCIDHDNNPLLTDQRGLARHLDGADPDFDATCDIGSVEHSGSGIVFADGFESGNTGAWSGGSY